MVCTHRHRRGKAWFVCACGCFFLGAAVGVSKKSCAQPDERQTISPQLDPALPVDFSADSLFYDEEARIVTAKGQVEFVQGARILRADEVIYDLSADLAIAVGHVALLEPGGEVYFADEVEMTRNLDEGFVRGLRGVMADGARLAAERGERSEGGRITRMYDARYTPCEPCEKDPESAPAWQIRARKITHDAQAQTVSYENARFEFSGVPLVWTPYFSHPDWTVTQKSGFLSPSFGWDSNLGAMARSDYYYAIAPHRDATVGMKVTTAELPVLLAQYRQRGIDSDLAVEGSITKSGRVDESGGADIARSARVRGHFFGKAAWDISDHWRGGVDLELTSDDQYLRQYDLSEKDVLENQIFAERFSGRDYTVVRALAFQDVRVGDSRRAQPGILPEIVTTIYGAPGETWGGRWMLDLSALGLRRDGDGRDMGRVVTQAGWQRRGVSEGGIVTTVDALLRGDLYHVRAGQNPTDSRVMGETTTARGFAQVHAESRYPFVKTIEQGHLTLEPIVSLSLAPNIPDRRGIPNEDSQDVQLDAINVFSSNRFSGQDRIEDGIRATYGVRTGLYTHADSRAEVFLGQSYRFDSDEDLFPEGSGLSRQSSDIVGQIGASYKEKHGIDYRFQLASENLASRRHEIDAHARFGRLELGSRYLFASAIEDSSIQRSREQIEGRARLGFGRSWFVSSQVLYDLGEDRGMRRGAWELGYQGQCLSISSTLERELTRESSGDSGTRILFRIGLKNLGEFETLPLRLDGGDE